MPKFVYRAKKENAETVVGELNAVDVDEADLAVFVFDFARGSRG